MFSDSNQFNADISQWDVSRVEKMRRMLSAQFYHVLCGPAWVAQNSDVVDYRGQRLAIPKVGCCPNGTYWTRGNNHCNNCTTGRFYQEDSSRHCNMCSYGKYNDEKGTSQCKDCEFGTY